MELLAQILQNARVSQTIIQENLYNPILKTADYQPREVYQAIKDDTEVYFQTYRASRMIGLAGLRGTGKTTLLWQVAEYIFQHFTQEVYFFHLGDLQRYDIGIAEIQSGFEHYLIKDRLPSHRNDIVILCDEIHEDPNWARDLKILYDLFPSAFVIATGSSALLLQATADLVTRMHIHHIFPLSFTEYLSLTQESNQPAFNLNDELKEAIFHSENINELAIGIDSLSDKIKSYYQSYLQINDLIKDYISYRNITRFSMLSIDAQINTAIKDLIKRVIHEDIPKFKTNINPYYAEKIITRLAASDQINTQTLSQSIGIAQAEIIEILEILSKAELLNILYPYGGIDTKVNKAQKYFFMSPSIRRVILSPIMGVKSQDDLLAKLLEDTVVLYLKRLFAQDSALSFVTQKDSKNPDFIIETWPKPIIIEAGIGKKTYRQITKSKIDFKYGIVVSFQANEIFLDKKNRILILPLRYFLLL